MEGLTGAGESTSTEAQLYGSLMTGRLLAGEPGSSLERPLHKTECPHSTVGDFPQSKRFKRQQGRGHPDLAL